MFILESIIKTAKADAQVVNQVLDRGGLVPLQLKEVSAFSIELVVSNSLCLAIEPSTSRFVQAALTRSETAHSRPMSPLVTAVSLSAYSIASAMKTGITRSVFSWYS